MRRFPVILLVGVLAVALSGCHGADRAKTADTEGGGDGNGATDPFPTGTSDGGSGDQATGDGGAGGTPSPGGDTGQPTPSPAPQRKKDDPSQVERPGEYAMLPYREDRRTDVLLEVPTWKDADRWGYEQWQALAPACTPAPGSTSTDYRYTDLVTGTSTVGGESVYEVERTVQDCKGTTLTQADHRFLVDHLLVRDDDGYVAPIWLFPLEDGKRWAWRADRGDDYTSEITYRPAYVWDGRTVVAWEVVSTREDGAHMMQRVFGAAAANLIVSEDTVDGAPIVRTRLVSYERGG